MMMTRADTIWAQLRRAGSAGLTVAAILERLSLPETQRCNINFVLGCFRACGAATSKRDGSCLRWFSVTR